MTHKVVILGFSGVQALDLVGPFDVFTGASLLSPASGRCPQAAYEVALASVDGQPVTTGTGLGFVTTKLPDPREPVDTVLLPGGIGVDDARANPEVMDWLRTAAHTARRVVSVCTGVPRGRGRPARWLPGHHALGVRAANAGRVPGRRRRP